MAQDYNVRFSGDTEQLKKALQDVKDRFERTSASVKPLRQKLSELRKQMELVATSELSQTTEGQELYNKLREAAQQYDKTLRQIQNDSRVAAAATAEVEQPAQSLSQKVTEIKRQMEDLITTGKIATAEGKAMWESLADEAKSYNDAIEDVNKAAKKGAHPKFSLKDSVTDLADQAGLGGLGKIAGVVAGTLNPVTVGVAAVGGAMIAAGKATAEFETHLNSLQSLTGLTDKEMKGLANSAKQMSGQFYIDAGEIVDGMKIIGSQAPELLKNSKALSEVTEAANVLSKAAQIDVADAAKAITGTMNQMGASASEAKDIINTFAAASQQGSADVEYLNRVFEKSGTSASDAGMDYVQLAAAVEAIAPKFNSADEAGTKMAGTLLKLSISGKSEFTPAVVGMSKALENLANAGLTNEEMLKLVGEGNLKMLQSLIENREQFDAYTKSLAGTDTAFEQMAINMKGWNAMVEKAKSTWKNFLLTLGDSMIMQGLMENIGILIDFVSEFVSIVDDIVKAFETWEDQTEEGTEAFNLYKMQLDAVITAIGYVGDAIEIVIALFGKLINWIRSLANWVKTCTDESKKQWDSFVQKLSDDSFLKRLIGFFKEISQKFRNMVNGMKQVWNDLMDFLGMERKKVAIEGEKKETVTEEKKENKNVSTNQTTVSTDTEKKSKSSKSKSEKTEKIDYLVSVDDSSLDVAEKKLQAWQNKRKTIKIDDVQGLKECNEQIKKWQEEVTKRKLIIEVGNDVYDNLDKLQAKLSELEDIKSMMVNVDFEAATDELTDFINELNALNNSTVNVDVEISQSPEKLDAEIAELKDKILIETIKVGFKPEIETGSKAYLENEIKKLEDAKTILFSTQADPATIKRVDDEVKNLKKQLEAEEIRLGVKPEIQAGSLNEIRKKIKEKEEEISLALNTDIDPESMRKLQSELDDLRKEEKEKSIEIGVTKNVATISKNSESWSRGSVEDKRQSLSTAQSMVKEIQENYRLKLIGKDEVETQLSEINSKLEELNLKPIELTFNDDGTLTTATEDLERYKNQMSEVSDMIGGMGSAFGSLGSAIGGTTGSIMQFAGQSINAIAQLIPQIVTLITAKQAESTVALVSGASQMQPWPAAIAAVAASVATIASIFASLPKFESGGIVGGSSFTGDKLLARVNSGEMILNKTQQRNLYNSMNYAEVGQPVQNTLRGDVNFTISGSALKGTLKNYDSKMSKIK